jgi:hypothetical protein
MNNWVVPQFDRQFPESCHYSYPNPFIDKVLRLTFADFNNQKICFPNFKLRTSKLEPQTSNNYGCKNRTWLEKNFKRRI